MGICHICGNDGPLTREHVPPRAVGNSIRVCVHTLYSLSKGWASGETFQAGLTRSTLCSRCNSRTGRDYVPEFARWALQACDYAGCVARDTHIALPFTFSVLRVAKELGVLTLVMSDTESLDLPHFFRLRRLVTQAHLYGHTPRFRFFTYFHVGPPVFEGPFDAIGTSGGPSPSIFCQVGLEPLGYIVTGDDNSSIAWAKQLSLCDISHFFWFPLNVLRTEHLVIPRLRGQIPFRPIVRP